MKNFPLPSFFKIRLVALLVGFFVVCFLLGAAKHVFAAADDPPCGFAHVRETGSPASGCYTLGSGSSAECVNLPSFNGTSWVYPPNTPIGEGDTYCGVSLNINVSTYVFNESTQNWDSIAYVSIAKGTWYCSDPIGFASYPTTFPSPPQCEDCNDERAALATQCGGDNNIMNWDDQACTGECKPDCDEAYANLLVACGGRRFIDWFDDETCLGECVTCDDVREDCESKGINVSDASSFRCTDSGWIEPADEGGNFGQYWHTGIDAEADCGFDSGFDPENPGPDDPPKDPPPPDPPADRPCFELEADCIARCNGKVQEFQCTEGDTYRCRCTDDAGPPDPTPNPTPSPDTPPDPGDDAPPGTPGDSPGTPDGTNDNELLGKISTNLKGIADNTNRIGDINQAEFNKLNATATDIKNAIGNGNTMLGQIEAAQNKGNEHLKDIAKDIGKIENNTDGIEDLLGDIKDIFDEDFTEIGSGNPTEAYSPTEEEFNIGERFDTFISRIRNTGVFALPNDFFNAPPSGGSPIFTFEFGSYGTRTVDLSDMSQPLLILRTIVLIAFSFVCLRIVILKR